jgi:tripartite-type tricarboxylate transporter receptor subunit TctC
VNLRGGIGTLLSTALLAGGANAGSSQPYPGKAMRFIVPYPPGRGNDFVARVIAPKLAETFRQPVVIDNRVVSSLSLRP